MSNGRLSGLDILIVEDELMLRKRLSAQLERLGANVTTAETLQAARTFCANMGFISLLLDVNLPDGTGTDLLNKSDRFKVLTPFPPCRRSDLTDLIGTKQCLRAKCGESRPVASVSWTSLVGMSSPRSNS